MRQPQLRITKVSPSLMVSFESEGPRAGRLRMGLDLRTPCSPCHNEFAFIPPTFLSLRFRSSLFPPYQNLTQPPVFSTISTKTLSLSPSVTSHSGFLAPFAIPNSPNFPSGLRFFPRLIARASSHSFFHQRCLAAKPMSPPVVYQYHAARFIPKQSRHGHSL